MPPTEAGRPYVQCSDPPWYQAESKGGSDDRTCSDRAVEVGSLTIELSSADKALLDQHIHSKPLTTDVLLASTLRFVETYNRSRFQETLRKLDPLFSHIKSFSSIVDVFVQTNPAISGLVWGSLHLAITVGFCNSSTKVRHDHN